MAIDLSERTPARLALRLLLLGAVLLLGYRFLRGAVHYVTSGDLRDFVHGYTTARWVLAHGWDGLYDLSIQVASQREFIDRAGSPWLALPFVNLPPMVFLFMPLAPLPPEAALACWISANVLLGVAAIAAVVRFMPMGRAADRASHHSRPAGPWPEVFGVFVALAFAPFAWGLLVGQAVGLTLLLSTVAFLALARGSPVLGGVSLALVGVVKPHLIVGAALLLLAQRRWSALVALALAGLGSGMVSLALVGTGGVQAYFRLLERLGGFPGDPQLGVLPSFMVNWRSWIARVPGITADAGMVATALAAALTLGFVWYRWRAEVSDARSFARAFLCFTAAGLVSGLHMHYQDLVLLLPAGIVCGWEVWRDARSALAATSWVGLRAARAGAAQLIVKALRWPAPAGIGAAALLVAIPSAAWAMAGVRILLEWGVFAALAGPGLILVVLATLPGRICPGRPSLAQQSPRNGSP